MSKTTTLQLYDTADDLACSFKALENKATFEAVGSIKFKGSSLALVHTDASASAYDLADVGEDVFEDKEYRDETNDAKDAVIIGVENDIVALSVDRVSKKVTMQNEISAEESRSISVINSKTSALNSDATTRMNTDMSNETDANNEIALRGTQIIALNTHIQEELTDFDTAYQAADSAADGRLDSLMSVGQVSATTLKAVYDTYSAADTTQLALIATLQSEIAELAAKFDNHMIPA